MHQITAGILLALLTAVLLEPQPAGAQADASPGPTRADIELQIGDYDGALNDWPVTAIIITADIDDDTTFSVNLQGTGGRELWRVDTQFNGPSMTIPVTGVAVGEVTGTELSTNLVAGELIVPQLGDQSQGGGGSTGQVATSMALVIIVAVILFRTPLPAAATQRWTR